MPKKTTNAYKCILNKLIEQVGTSIHIASIMADYENGLRAAIRTQLPATTINGCWFHFSQAILKKSKKLNLWQISDTTKQIIKMAVALPLLPEIFMMEGINEIEKRANSSGNDFRTFVAYLKMWQTKNISVHGRSMRTNNNVESFNRTLLRVVGRIHANIWHLISKLRLFEANSIIEISRVDNSVDYLSGRKIAYKLLDKKIESAQLKLNYNGKVSSFLNHVAFNHSIY